MSQREDIKIAKLRTYLVLSVLVATATGAAAQQPDAMPVVVNSSPAGAQTGATVVSDSTGALLVAWHDSTASGKQINIQGFDRLGHRSSRLLQASTQVFLGTSGAELAANPGGQAVLCWEEDVGSFTRIVFRMLNIDGSPRTGVLPLPGLRVIVGREPSVAIDSLGNVALVWTGPSPDGEGDDIVGNLFGFHDSTGTANEDTLVFGWTGNFLINEQFSGRQNSPSVASDRQGRLLVAWRDLRPDSLGVFCRAFSSRGVPLGSFRLNRSQPEEIDSLGAPVVAAAGLNPDSSTFMVSWVERDTLGVNLLMLAKVDLELSLVPVAAVDTAFTQTVPAPAGLAFDTPALSGNENGQVSLVWMEDNAGTSELHSVIFERSSPILPPMSLKLTSSEPGFGEPAAEPAASMGVDGSLALVWTDNSGADPDLRLQRYNSLGEVVDPVFASPGSGRGDNRAVTFLGRPAGGYTMYWEHEYLDTLRIYDNDFDIAGRPLASPSPLNAGGAGQRKPVAAENKAGFQALAWEEYDNGNYRVMLELLKIDGTVVREPFAVASSASSHLGSLALAVSDSGLVALLWERWNQSSGAPDLMLARLDSLGNTLGSQLTVAPASSGGGRLASAAAAPDGNLMVTWRQGASGSENAQIRARVYSSTGSVVRDRIKVSRDTLEYLGSSSQPAVAASDSSGNFLVLWQEFFSSRNLLYYRLYSNSGDSLQLPSGAWRARLSSAAALNDANRVYNSAAAAVDSAGGFLVVWSEGDPTGTAGMFGTRFDPYAKVIGSEFQVPGVRTATLPVIRILDQRRVAIAWQDTTGERISFLGVQLDFHALLGRVLLASGGITAGELTVHAAGAMTDSVAAAADGSFRFEGLIGGRYRVWVSSNGSEIPGSSQEIILSAGSGPEVDMGVAADLRGVPGPALPRAGAIELAQNVPNPFNPSTTVSFTLAGSGPQEVRLAVYDLRGALVSTLLSGPVEPGTHRLEWDGRDELGHRAASGVYFLRLTAGSETRLRKMILLK